MSGRKTDQEGRTSPLHSRNDLNVQLDRARALAARTRKVAHQTPQRQVRDTLLLHVVALEALIGRIERLLDQVTDEDLTDLADLIDQLDSEAGPTSTLH